ncbi:MerR family transcriptional regulator [Streptococcus massiliensis]|uniref:Putative transcriptional regulator n=1 Tax=Streptococcus massiliensis TaxID=313439 RepID=A0A380KXK8_9STRE|nr:MerR family transcriptional regulator [Streptococcus massiliensis]SUN76428.1 putative transcriptional regulator [Streptococcus massiliensis]
MYTIKQAAQLAGVSIKTLRHYDKIGLLVPHKDENAYRYYSDADLERLQLVLFYKLLGFSLAEISHLLSSSDEDLLPHLEKQLSLLEQESGRLATLIHTLQKTIQAQKGEILMTIEEKFQGFTYKDHKAYQDQAIATYGSEVIEEAQARQAGKEDEVTAAFNFIFQTFAEQKEAGLSVEAVENQKLAQDLHDLINTYGFDCSLEVFGAIGHGYVENPEFRKNLDKFGQDVTQYVSDSIQVYVTSAK